MSFILNKACSGFCGSASNQSFPLHVLTMDDEDAAGSDDAVKSE